MGNTPPNFYNKGYELNESQLRYAMSNTISNAQAARWLHISAKTWKKYASMYIDEASGLTLFELHKLTGRKNRKVLPKAKNEKRKIKPWQFVPVPLTDIFAGLKLNYPVQKIKERLISEMVKTERCEVCGFQERRKFDYLVPLRLSFKDGNTKNFKLENLQLLCFNCYFIHVGNLHGVNKRAMIDEDTGEVVTVNKHYRRT
jgi:5-methylcytosine-specific restriction endonuclease McrA